VAGSRLRIYFGPQKSVATDEQSGDDPHTVNVSLGEVFPLLADAVQNRRTWLEDFEDEEITISSDLYEVLLAYQHYRRPSA